VASDLIEEAVTVAVSMGRHFEGVRLRPYLCSANVPTIGIGATYYENGTRVTLTDPAITMERAEQLHRWQIRTQFLPAVLRLCPAVDTANRLAALVDFAFNLGINALKTSTLRKCVNAGDWAGARVQIRRWNKAGGRVLRGLTIRREAEAALL